MRHLPKAHHGLHERVGWVAGFLLSLLSLCIRASALEWQGEDGAKPESILLDSKAKGGKALLIPISEEILRKAGKTPETTWVMKRLAPDLKPGWYEATLRFAYSRPEEPLSRAMVLEFTAADKTRTIECAAKEKPRAYQEIPIRFEVAATHPVNVGVGWTVRSAEDVANAIRSSHMRQSLVHVAAGAAEGEVAEKTIVDDFIQEMAGSNAVAIDEIRLAREDTPACIVAVRPGAILLRQNQAAEAEVLLRNYTETEFRGELKVTENPPSGTTAGQGRILYSKKVRLAGGADAEIGFSWPAGNDASKRELKAELMQGNRTLDSAAVPCFPFRGANVWQGRSSAWSAAENWSAGAVPGDQDGYDLLISGNAPQQPVSDRDATVAGSLAIDNGGSLTLRNNLTVRGDLVVRAGAFNMGDQTLTIGGSCVLAPYADSLPPVRWEMGEKGRIVFNTASKAVFEPGSATNRADYRVRFQNVTVDKRGGVLTIRKRPLVVEKNLSIEEGTIAMQEGGEVWLGVLRGGPEKENILDVALRIRSRIAPENNPTIARPLVPEPTPSVVAVIHAPPIGPVIPSSVELVNIARFAAIKTVPYMTMARTLTDQDEALRTVATPEGGTPVKGARYEFRYDKPQTIAAIHWAVVAGPWAILADTTGDGTYDKLLRMDLRGKLSNPGGVWVSRAWVHNTFWPPVKAYAIQVVSLLGAIENNCLYDVQILSPAKEAAFLPPQPEKGVPEMTAGPAIEVAAPPVERQFLKGFHIEPWMFSVLGWLKADSRPPLSEYPGFTNFVAGVKRMHGNALNMWPPTTFESKGPGEYESDLLWPSQYDRHSLSENALQTIAEALHNAGIRLFVMQRNAYPKSLEEFPETSASKQETPNVVGRHAREYLAGVVREQAASGVDGVGIGFDEQGAWGMALSPKAYDALTRKVFDERFHVPFPEGPADTESFRKWVVFAYGEFASYLREASSAAKAANPTTLTRTPTHMSLGSLWNDRLNVGLAEDIIGHTADLDYVRANGYQDSANLRHYIAAASTKRMIAANRTRGADLLMNCPWTPDTAAHPGYYLDFTPVHMCGAPISHIMNGGQMPLYWRYNYTFYGGYDKYVEQAYSILDTLAAWGAREARVPRSIAVLKSRASEDWWQVRQRYGKEGNPMDQTRGYLYEKWLLEFLFTGGYPFEMYYLDQPEDLKDLSQFQLAILPFPYSLSKEAYARLEDAVNKGSKLLVFDRQGETDEWGEPHEKPLLAGLISQGKATFVGDDMPSAGHYPQVLENVRQTVDGLLGDRKPLYLNTHDNDVEVSMLEKGTRERFVSVINWTDRPVWIDIGVNSLPAGQYRVFQRDLAGAREARLGGKGACSADDLKKFRLSLEKWEVKVLYIHPAAGT